MHGFWSSKVKSVAKSILREIVNVLREDFENDRRSGVRSASSRAAGFRARRKGIDLAGNGKLSKNITF